MPKNKKNKNPSSSDNEVYNVVDDIVYDDIEYSSEEETKKSEAKIKKVKQELKNCKKELKEHIDLLQKLKIDILNIKSDSESKVKNATKSANIEFARKILPVFDSLDIALSFFKDESDTKKGIENVYSQLISVFQDMGFVVYGEVLDDFDPNYFEAISKKETDKKEHGNKVAEVFQKGIKHKDGDLIRPAKVSVFVFNS